MDQDDYERCNDPLMDAERLMRVEAVAAIDRQSVSERDIAQAQALALVSIANSLLFIAQSSRDGK